MKNCLWCSNNTQESRKLFYSNNFNIFPSRNSLETWINCQDIDGDGQWTDDQCDRQHIFLPSRWRQLTFPGGCGVMNIYTNLWYSAECNRNKAAICEIEKGMRIFIFIAYLKGLGPYLKPFLYNANCTDIFV